jgi:hypothetical protein
LRRRRGGGPALSLTNLSGEALWSMGAEDSISAEDSKAGAGAWAGGVCHLTSDL